MSKPLRAIKNQHGAGLLIVVAVLGILVAGLIVSTQQLLDNTVRIVTQQRDRIAAIQGLQDFALLAQKANEVWVRTNTTNCPAGWTELPEGFCWQGPFPNARDCIANPIGSNTDICLMLPSVATPAVPTMNVAVLHAAPIHRGYLDRWRDQIAEIYTYRREIIDELHKQVAGLMNSEAHAARPEMFLPEVGAPGPVGPSQQTINNMGCGPLNPFAQPSCKVCTGGAANVRCLELRICVRANGCRDVNNLTFRDWYRQRIGIIPRS